MKLWIVFFILLFPCMVQGLNIGQKLQPGHTIGIIAVSSATLDYKEVLESILHLHQLGFKIKVAPNVYEDVNFFPGDAKTRARSLENFFQDPEVDAIMALRGGYGAIHILDLLDYNIIKQNPKVFIGYSDLTSLEWALYKHANLMTFYGPCLTSFAKENYSPVTGESMLSVLAKGQTEIINNFDVLYPKMPNKKLDNNKIEESQSQEASSSQQIDYVEGELVGGNLSTLMSIIGTPYEIDLKGKIFFFEDLNERVMSIDRMISHLVISGRLDSVKAIVVGQMLDICKRNGHVQNLYDMIEERLKHLGVPIIIHFPTGHDSPMYTVPVGAKVRFDLINKTMTLLEPVVK